MRRKKGVEGGREGRLRKGEDERKLMVAWRRRRRRRRRRKRERKKNGVWR